MPFRRYLFSSLLFLLSCEFPPSPLQEEPSFEDVQWDAFPSDFLIATIKYDALQGEPFTIRGHLSRVYRLRKAERRIEVVAESNVYVFRDIALSPDGTLLAFCYAPIAYSGSLVWEQGTRQIHVMNLQNSSVSQYGGDTLLDHSGLVWSPQGRLAFLTKPWGARDSNATVWVDGFHRFDPMHPYTEIFWSGDGSALYFVGGVKGFGGHVKRLDAGTWMISTLLTNTSGLFGCIPVHRGIYLKIPEPYGFFLSYDGMALTPTDLLITGTSFVFPSDNRIIMNRLGNDWVSIVDTEAGTKTRAFTNLPGTFTGFCPVF